MKRAELDRLCELAGIGAEHAAAAFAQLVARPVALSEPRVVEQAGADDVEAIGREWCTGVLFELEGPICALVGLLFRAPVRDALVRRVLGEALDPLPIEMTESVLMEVGNIVVSHVASGIAESLGVRLLPSIPSLAMDGADLTLADQIDRRPESCLRIECELIDPETGLGGLLVLVP